MKGHAAEHAGCSRSPASDRLARLAGRHGGRRGGSRIRRTYRSRLKLATGLVVHGLLRGGRVARSLAAASWSWRRPGLAAAPALTSLAVDPALAGGCRGGFLPRSSRPGPWLPPAWSAGLGACRPPLSPLTGFRRSRHARPCLPRPRACGDRLPQALVVDAPCAAAVLVRGPSCLPLARVPFRRRLLLGGFGGDLGFAGGLGPTQTRSG